MKIKNIFIIFIILISLIPSVSAIDVTGYITNILEAPIQSARIDIDIQHTFTNSSGYYIIPFIPDGNYTILVRAIGYNNLTSNISILSNSVLNYTIQERKMAVVKMSPGFDGIVMIVILLSISLMGKICIKKSRKINWS
jgi:hypothetical protein